MSMPSDVNPDLAEAVHALEEKVPPRIRDASAGVARRVSPESYGFAAAVLAAFFGVAILGPRLSEMRKPRHRRMIDRIDQATDRVAGRARRRARETRDAVDRGVRRLGDKLSPTR